MTITRCDVCKGETSVTSVFITYSGEYAGKPIETEARIDLCSECKLNFVGAIVSRDTHVRAAKGVEPRP